MAADRYAPSRSGQIRLGGDRVLVIAELIASMCEELGEQNPEIGDLATLPAGDEMLEAIENQSPVGAVIARQVVDVRGGGRVRRRLAPSEAVEVGRAFNLE